MSTLLPIFEHCHNLMPDTFHFDSKTNPVFFIAEIGGNHEGDFDYARRLAALAIESGVDAIKFQLYSGDTLVSRVESPERNKHFKRFELAKTQYLQLARMCNDAGVEFMASVWGSEMLDWIDPYIPIHKVGSGDLTCYPLIRQLVATGKPIILSTGLATLAEITDAVGFIETLDKSYVTERKLAILQCNSAYPTPDGDANLDVIATFRNTFGLPIGYSDHTIGTEAIEVAVAMGATIIEAHFTDTREGKTFRDHKVSLTRDEVRDLMLKLRRIRTLKGDSEKRVTPSEAIDGHPTSFRRSIYAKRDIAIGEALTMENMTVLRPAHGLPATDFDRLLGKTVMVAIAAHQLIREDDFH